MINVLENGVKKTIMYEEFFQSREKPKQFFKNSNWTDYIKNEKKCAVIFCSCTKEANSATWHTHLKSRYCQDRHKAIKATGKVKVLTNAGSWIKVPYDDCFLKWSKSKRTTAYVNHYRRKDDGTGQFARLPQEERSN